MSLWAFVLSFIAALIAAGINQISARKIDISYETAQYDDNDKGCIYIHVVNNSILPVNHIESYIRCVNVVFGSSELKKVNISIGGKSSERYKIPINSIYCGRIDLKVERCYVYDWLDFSYHSVKTVKQGCYYAYPKEEFLAVDEEVLGGSEGEETTYKHVVGNDVSEILQIREYRKGDSIKNIHWKISAKMGTTMVKELDTPNDNSILILFDYEEKEKKSINNKIIAAVYNISNELMKECVGHTIYRMDTSKERVVDRIVTAPEEFDIMQQEILETEAKYIGKNVSDYVMDQNICNQYARIIYVKSKALKDNSGIEDLEQCYTVDI